MAKLLKTPEYPPNFFLYLNTAIWWLSLPLRSLLFWEVLEQMMVVVTNIPEQQ
jgi:hypothetical protein